MVEPVTLVIFGGAGDLAHRKLLPALTTCVDGLLPPLRGRRRRPQK
jgi:glucose-6-phosphate 1-dehydrogenase